MDIMASTTKGPIERFFQRYIQYTYDPHSKVWSEYHRLCEFFGWDKGSTKEEKVRKLLRQALVDEFKAINDKNENDLAVLRRLCQRLEISPLPKSVRYRDDMKALAMRRIASDAIARKAGPMDLFFNRYNQFGYDPHSKVWSEYHRLCEFFGWDKGSTKEEKVRKLLRQALVDEFEAINDKNENDLAVLRRLCQRLEISPLPKSVRYRDDIKALATGDKAGDALVRTASPIVRIAGPMDLFFNRYNQFGYDPHSKVWSEYHRLCEFFGWDKGSTKEEKVRKLLRQALVDEFEAINDKNENDLAVLRRLCQRLEISPLPKSVRYRDDMKALAMRRIASDAIARKAGPMDLFFNRYNQFGYDPHSKVWSEYHRLCEFFGWDKGSTKEEKVRKLLRQALVDEFEAINDKNENDLAVLRRLCQRLEISPLPKSVRYRDDIKALATGDKAGDALVRTASPIVRIAGPMDLFFSRYSQFDYDPHSQVWSEYNRLCGYFRWDKGSPTEKTVRKLFRQALVDEFGAIYGEKDDKLDVLQLLCRKLKVDPLPQTLTDCREAIQAHYVNIVDFVDCERTGKPIPKFSGLEKLRRYTIDKNKIFPKEEAKASLLLRFLLQNIF